MNNEKLSSPDTIINEALNENAEELRENRIKKIGEGALLVSNNEIPPIEVVDPSDIEAIEKDIKQIFNS